MADYSMIGEKYGLIYTCNCGWLDRAHSYPESTRPGVGAANLWRRIQNEEGMDEMMGRFYVLSYRQDALKKIGSLKLYPGAGELYVIRRKLSNVQKQQVALAIFMEVSLKFEGLQDSWLARKLTATDSGFSEEDLVSDLIGFYKALYPKLDVDTLCKPVSIEASKKVWKDYGPVGVNKNKTFRPKFHACDECKGIPVFPKEFGSITPATKGELFDQWVPPPQLLYN